MKLQIAHEEDKKRIHAINKIAEKRGYETEVCKLEVGDYVINDIGFAVEYKTSGDYISSVADGRLHNELMGMKDQYENSFLVVVNDFKNCYFNGGFRGVTAERLRKSIASTAARYGGVKLVFYETKGQAYEGIFDLIESSEKGEKVESPVKITQTKTNYEHPDTYMLMCLPHVGTKTAEKIAVDYSFIEFITLPEELQKKYIKRKETLEFMKIIGGKNVSDN